MHLCESIHKQPNTNVTRLIVGFLWLYVMVLGISYSSNLTAFLTISRQPQEIDTFEDLYASGLHIVGLGPIFGILMNSSGNVYLKKLSRRFIPLTSDPESWVTSGRAGYISSYHYTKYTVDMINSVYNKPVCRLMKECTWPFSVAVALQSYSPLKPRFDQVVNRIVESGMVAYWFQDSVWTATQVIQQDDE
ncbi:hypothetical protein Pmani_018106 [Petrolisthes manimaculis]|uniref:Ionotropic glutamate receptor C-terminal domain-containing protein n=1 Tax=Petrolisthes manimaculis TaxID=1843537 RepID=A0AAE1PNB7_9EUCA|nr:hypothetical protein Pmani_018106 [Petrolisthes manimaculis]